MKRALCLVSAMNVGGAETFLMKVYRKMDKTKYQLDFCVNTQEKGFYDKEIKEMGGRIFYIPPKSQNFLRYRRELTALVHREKYHYVFRTATNALGLLDLRIAKKAGAEYCTGRSNSSGNDEGAFGTMVNAIGRLLFAAAADVKIAPSELAAEHLFGAKAVRAGNVHYLRNGLDLDVYRFDPTAREDVCREFAISDGFLLGHVGRFNAAKNHEFLLDVFHALLKMRPDATLLLIGCGEREALIREKTAQLGLDSHVIFAGLRKDIPRLLSALDVFALPSFYEGMPNAVIEAQATGLPCVISDSLTRQANITGLVRYLPLSAPTEQWAQTLLDAGNTPRRDTKSDFLSHRYDIESTAADFVRLVFQE